MFTHTNVPECENVHDDTAECQYWRYIGEVARGYSQDFMLEQCYKTVSGCQPVPKEDGKRWSIFVYIFYEGRKEKINAHT